MLTRLCVRLWQLGRGDPLSLPPGFAYLVDDEGLYFVTQDDEFIIIEVV